MHHSITSPVIVALDNMTMDSALALADRLDPALCRLKVGKELFTRCGPTIIKNLHQRQFEVFLDFLQLHLSSFSYHIGFRPHVHKISSDHKLL